MSLLCVTNCSVLGLSEFVSHVLPFSVQYQRINATQLKIRCQISYHTTHSFLHLRRACLLSAQYFKGY